MRRLKRFVRASWTERLLLLRALFVVCITRLGLWVLPIGTVRRIALSGRKGTRVVHPVPTLVWAVRASSRFVPLATCLTQALALQWLLSRSGHTSRIHLGARRDASGKFEAHAWVECEDRVVMGGAKAEDYVPLTAWER